MQKLSNQSKDISQENIKKVEELFPNCVTETYDKDGNLVRSIDFDILRQDLSSHVVEGPKERYQFNWPGKRGAILLANAPTTNTLRPLPEKSVDFENTKNVYIEGDNLEALKILRETYMGKIKMIYIDPPYNTGNDFVYKDDFKQSTEEYLKSSGGIDEGGNRMEVNGESNGRFHSDWLNMMYPRLVLARDLLTDDGVIFISIDDSEQHHLRNICDDIFGANNFIAQCVRKRRNSQANLSHNISPIHEYVIIYAKENGDLLNKVSANIDEKSYKNPDSDPRGAYVTMPCTNKGGCVYTVKTPTGKEITEEWRFKRETYDQLLKDNRIVFPKDGQGKPRYKLYLTDKKKEGQLANTWLDFLPSNQEATKEIAALFGNVVFDTPKPVGLIQFLVNLASDKESYILDFFSGSASTGEAVLKQNMTDSGNRKYILIQLPEKTNENSIAFKNGYLDICQIAIDRLRKAGEKMQTESPLISDKLDFGFRVYKLDSSNMKDNQSIPADIQLSILEDADSAIKPDRSSLDLVIQVMLRLDITLDASIQKRKCLDGAIYYSINDNDLICCFDKNISESDIEEIARMQPLNVAFRDDSFASDQDEVNCEQIFKTLSPITGKNIFVL